MVVSLVMSLVVILGGAFLFLKQRRRKTELKIKNQLESIWESKEITVKQFGFEEINHATNHFHRRYRIGQGGFGSVYRGKLSDGSAVAVKGFKKWSMAGDAASVFTREVEVNARMPLPPHDNIVHFLGYCVAAAKFFGVERIIVHEFISNGSLDDHLFGRRSRRNRLTWPNRRNIILGVARGLRCLHYANSPIIHCDIKPANILLDDNFNAKIADFGCAKMYEPEQGHSHEITKVTGTVGYIAPEYARSKKLSERADVYSFGVLMLELLSGKKAVSSSVMQGGMMQTGVAKWAEDLIKGGHALNVIEEGMTEKWSDQLMELYVKLADMCSRSEKNSRPTMNDVVRELESPAYLPSPQVSHEIESSIC